MKNARSPAAPSPATFILSPIPSGLLTIVPNIDRRAGD
jgi:hypothetical protein